MPVNSEPTYYQLLLGDNIKEQVALSAPSGPNPGGDLVNATPDETSDRQLWELVVWLLSGHEGDDGLRVAMRNKYTGFVAVAPVGDNTLGVTQEGFVGNLVRWWTSGPGGIWGWGFVRPAPQTKISSAARGLAAKSASGCRCPYGQFGPLRD